MFSNARGMAICIGVTGVASILLWFYFKNRIENVETKLDSMFNMIQNFSNEQAPTPNNQEMEYYQEEADPFENKSLDYANQMVSEQLPQENEVVTEEMVNKELIKVSDNEESGSDGEESGSDGEESESDGESGSDGEESESDGEEEDLMEKTVEVLKVTGETNPEKTIVLDLDSIKTINLSNDDQDSLDDVESEESEEEQEEGETVKNIEVKEEIHNYTSMKVSELKKHCSEKGLTGYTKLNKAGLVNLLENN